MQVIAQIMLVLLTVLTVSGHGLAPSVVFHAHTHDAALHDADDSHGHHGHQADSMVVALAPASDAAATDCPGGHCDGDQSGAHLHVYCCSTVMALPSTNVWMTPSTATMVDLPIGNASLALGELRYPLLRPPRRLI